MLSVEIKLNNEVIKQYAVTRNEEFMGWGATHTYNAVMIVDSELPGHMPDVYPMGKIEHRYCAGAVSLIEKLFKLARQKGMHK